MIYFLLAIAVLSNIVMDVLAHDYHTSVFRRLNPRFWDADESWKNKYKEGTTEERFPLSSTVLVFLTDGWHLSQFTFHSSWQLAVIWPQFDGINVLWYFLGLKTAFSLIFEIGYRLMRQE